MKNDLASRPAQITFEKRILKKKRFFSFVLKLIRNTRLLVVGNRRYDPSFDPRWNVWKSKWGTLGVQ